MSENIENLDNTAHQESEQVEKRLYAGKFESIEALEEGYKNTAKVHQDNMDLKSKMESYKVPESYSVPENLLLSDEELSEFKEAAKSANLTQENFDKLLSGMNSKKSSLKSAFSEAKKAIGDDKMNVLKDYVKNTYPPALHETIMNKLIVDKESREAALAHRNSRLSSTVPGMSHSNSGSVNVDKSDILRLHADYKKAPHDQNKLNAYLEATKAYAHNKKAMGSSQS